MSYDNSPFNRSLAPKNAAALSTHTRFLPQQRYLPCKSEFMYLEAVGDKFYMELLAILIF